MLRVFCLEQTVELARSGCGEQKTKAAARLRARAATVLLAEALRPPEGAMMGA